MKITLQTCPVCQGTGQTFRPPHIVGDVESWSTSDLKTYPCRACNGHGMIGLKEGSVEFFTLHTENGCPK